MRTHASRVALVFGRRAVLGLAPIGILIAALRAPSQDETRDRTSAVSFEPFRIVVERNIFDPNRRADRRGQDSDEEPGLAEAGEAGDATAVSEANFFESEQVALVGTLIDGATAVAFFESTNAEYDTVAEPGGAIAGFRIAEIRTEYVRLAKDGESVDLPVGSSMNSQEEGGWKVTSGSPLRQASRNGSEAASPKEERSVTEPEETKAMGNAGTSSVLDQLKQRRRKALVQ